MKMIISPAKSLNPKLGIPETKFSQPCFINDALKINGSLKKKSADDLSKLLKIFDVYQGDNIELGKKSKF